MSFQNKINVYKIHKGGKMNRYNEESLCDCNHPLVMFPNNVPGYETYKTYKCLKCGAIIEDGYEILYSKVNLKKEVKYLLYDFLHSLYVKLLNEKKNDIEIINEITNYYDFLIKEDLLKDINLLESKDINKLLSKSYELYKQIKNVVIDINKKKIKED